MSFEKQVVLTAMSKKDDLIQDLGFVFDSCVYFELKKTPVGFREEVFDKERLSLSNLDLPDYSVVQFSNSIGEPTFVVVTTEEVRKLFGKLG